MDPLSLALLVVIAIAVVVIVVSTRRRARARLAPGYVPVPDDAPYNTLAVVAFVTSFFVSIAGIVCGHLALGDIRRRNQRGRGLALAALWIGYLGLAASIAVGIVAIVLAVRH